MPTNVKQSLPYVCFVAGIVVPVVLQNIWAVGSGVAWISAGSAMLWKRRPLGKSPGDELVKLQHSVSGAKHVIWTKALESGNSAIDEEHRNLLKLGNELLDAVHNRQSRDQVMCLIDKLIREVESHFCSEERLLADWNHPITEQHKAEHENLLKKAMRLRTRALRDNLIETAVIDSLVRNLMYEHIDKVDREFFYEI